MATLGLATRCLHRWQDTTVKLRGSWVGHKLRADKADCFTDDWPLLRGRIAIFLDPIALLLPEKISRA